MLPQRYRVMVLHEQATDGRTENEKEKTRLPARIHYLNDVQMMGILRGSQKFSLLKTVVLTSPSDLNQKQKVHLENRNVLPWTKKKKEPSLGSRFAARVMQFYHVISCSLTCDQRMAKVADGRGGPPCADRS